MIFACIALFAAFANGGKLTHNPTQTRIGQTTTGEGQVRINVVGKRERHPKSTAMNKSTVCNGASPLI